MDVMVFYILNNIKGKSMLLSFEEIETFSKLKFGENSDLSELELAELILIPQKRDVTEDLGKIETKLNIIIPLDFKKFISKYNLDEFSLGSIAFGSGNYLNQISELNSENNFNNWWGCGERPRNLLLFAYNDPYSIVIDCISGEIEAFTSEDNRTKVASNFNLFFRGIGTVAFTLQKLSDIESEVGALNHEFWENIQRYG